VTSLAEHFDWRALIWPKTILDTTTGFWAKGRSRGPVLHPPLFGQLLGLVSLVPFYFLIRPLRPVARVLIGALLAGCLLGLFFTYTRGPWLAAVVGILLLGVLRRSYRRVLLVFAVVGVIGGLVGAVQLANTEFFKERVENTHTIDNRVGFMASALRMARDHPLFGVGFFRYTEYRGLYNQTTLVPLYGLVHKSDSATIAIHDIYIGRLAEEGLVSVGLLAAFTLVILRAFIHKWRAAPGGNWFNRDLLALFAAMMVCYMVGGMIIDFRYFDLVNVFFFFMAGLVYGFPVVAGAPAGTGRTGGHPLRINA
jgi:O-antigen ligase